ncbi:MAG: DASH family cryptochrome [Myxococcota bacterium]|nr:DASH family cryptochrome [Myxococcota bacterium]
MSLAILWHQNDLRLADNPALVAAAAHYDGNVLPVVCFNHAEWAELNPKTRAFRLETLQDLRDQYVEAGSDLFVLHGRPEVALPKFASESKADEVFLHSRYTAPHRALVEDVVSQLHQDGIATSQHWGDTLFDPETLPDELRDPPWQFGEFQELIAAQGVPPKPVARPTLVGIDAAYEPLPTLGDFGQAQSTESRSLLNGLQGGSSQGLKRLSTFFREGDHARDYARKRDQLLAQNATSRLSAYLAHGALSPRQVFHELKNYEKARVYNRSTRELTQELYQREFFHLVALAKGQAVYDLSGINSTDLQWDSDPDIFERWCKGMTGWPFIDAHMRELAATGYMTFRGRQNVACFFSRDLEQDWRVGAKYFETQLVDHEPCSNMGNWQRSAGVSPSPLSHRFSIRRQSMRYDKQARYIRQWVPEIAKLPTPTIHEMNGRDCSLETGAFGVRLDEAYPRPISRKTWKKRV